KADECRSRCGERRVSQSPARAGRGAGGALPAAGDLRAARLRRGWRADALRERQRRQLARRRHLRRSDSQGRPTGRSSGPAADQVRAGHQREGCARAWSRAPDWPAAARRRGDRMRRREFIAMLGGAAATIAASLAARAQPVPVVGILSSRSAATDTDLLEVLRQGLRDVGYSEGRNVAFQYRGADGRYDRLPAVAHELVRERVSVIVTIGGDFAALAAKAATTSIPIVFTIGGDPVGAGLVPNMNRPGGNLTGVT